MNTYLTFILGNELFAVPVINVLEVLQKQQITHLPNTPITTLLLDIEKVFSSMVQIAVVNTFSTNVK